MRLFAHLAHKSETLPGGVGSPAAVVTGCGNARVQLFCHRPGSTAGTNPESLLFIPADQGLRVLPYSSPLASGIF
jgi:hypothetical protein